MGSEWDGEATAEGNQRPSVFTPEEWARLAQKLGLVGRQDRIAQLILQGRSDKQIAGQLNLSLGTVRTYISRLHSRLQVRDRTELVVKLFTIFRQGCPLHRCPHQC